MGSWSQISIKANYANISKIQYTIVNIIRRLPWGHGISRVVTNMISLPLQNSTNIILQHCAASGVNGLSPKKWEIKASIYLIPVLCVFLVMSDRGLRKYDFILVKKDSGEKKTHCLKKKKHCLFSTTTSLFYFCP